MSSVIRRALTGTFKLERQGTLGAPIKKANIIEKSGLNLVFPKCLKSLITTKSKKQSLTLKEDKSQDKHMSESKPKIEDSHSSTKSDQNKTQIHMDDTERTDVQLTKVARCFKSIPDCILKNFKRESYYKSKCSLKNTQAYLESFVNLFSILFCENMTTELLKEEIFFDYIQLNFPPKKIKKIFQLLNKETHNTSKFVLRFGRVVCSTAIYV